MSIDHDRHDGLAEAEGPTTTRGKKLKTTKAMNATDILLGVNSILLTLLGILFGVVGHFLRDFHAQFKELSQTVTQLCIEVAKATTQAKADQENTRREIDELKNRNQ